MNRRKKKSLVFESIPIEEDIIKAEKITANETKWDIHYRELLKFKEQYGHCDVPHENPTPPFLKEESYRRFYAWVLFQRKRKKYGMHSFEPERIKKLNDIGFCWNMYDKWFEHHYRQLEKYHKENGHCRVAVAENKNLAKWCLHLRDNRRLGIGILTPQRIERLNKLEFEWEAYREEEIKKAWVRHFEELKEFKKCYGHCNAPNTPGSPQLALARWCGTQRRNKRLGKYKLLPDRVKKLNSIGFSWDVSDDLFEKNFSELKKYKQKYGHCRVSSKNNQSLRGWCHHLRNLKKIHSPTLTPERINKLNALEFEWEERNTAWLKHFNELKEFKKRYGHCNVPDTPGNPQLALARWCGTQRRNKRLGKYKLLPDRVKKLNAIGFSWEVLDELFEKHFNELKKFKQKYGHCHVSANINPELRKWCYTIRRYKKIKSPALTPERIKRLTELGFLWKPPKRTYEEQWMENCGELEKFVKTHHRLPYWSAPGYNWLWAWLRRQISLRKNNPKALPAQQIERLRKLGVKI